MHNTKALAYKHMYNHSGSLLVKLMLSLSLVCDMLNYLALHMAIMHAYHLMITYDSMQGFMIPILQNTLLWLPT